GSVEKAIILNQLIYWSERIKDFDRFITEENTRKEKHGIEEIEDLRHGWIYKTSQELSEETMLGKSPQTIRRYLDELIENGWIQTRKNPKYKWDQTYQYRINIVKIQSDLFELGYPLDGYEHRVSPISKMENGNTNGNIAISKMENGESKMEIQAVKIGDAIPEITTEITTEEIEEEESQIAEEKIGPVSCQQKPEKNHSEEVQMVMQKLGVELTLAFLLVDKCGDKQLLERVIDQLTNAKKPIKNMTAYLLTLMTNSSQWLLFIENVENEFLTRERPVKKREPKRQMPEEEEREIYFPPSLRIS
ncbi:MAG: hypothetical protein GX825_01935, partial [Syntrophomonadaceae bacterium]|nr:hypothetical protein [Syntrophomonadaceae bacterium]